MDKLTVALKDEWKGSRLNQSRNRDLDRPKDVQRTPGSKESRAPTTDNNQDRFRTMNLSEIAEWTRSQRGTDTTDPDRIRANVRLLEVTRRPESPSQQWGEARPPLKGYQTDPVLEGFAECRRLFDEREAASKELRRKGNSVLHDAQCWRSLVLESIRGRHCIEPWTVASKDRQSLRLLLLYLREGYISNVLRSLCAFCNDNANIRPQRRRRRLGDQRR